MEWKQRHDNESRRERKKANERWKESETVLIERLESPEGSPGEKKRCEAVGAVWDVIIKPEQGWRFV